MVDDSHNANANRWAIEIDMPHICPTRVTQLEARHGNSYPYSAAPELRDPAAVLSIYLFL